MLETARGAEVDLVIIDTRPSVEADAVQVASLSDYLLVPTRPAILDLRAILATLDIVKGGRHRASIVLNACQPPRGKVVEASFHEGRPPCPQGLRRACGARIDRQRAALSHALVGGQAVSETEPTSKASKELGALWRYVEKELKK